MKSVAIYVRLSKEDKFKIHSEDDSESIANQKSMLRDYCVDRNWEIYDIYCDEDFSGADSNRPEFNRMIKDCEKGNVNIVLCKSQSRFTRDMELVEKYIHNKFVEWGIRFIGVIDNVDTNVKGNKKARQIAGLTNEWYLEDTSINIRQVLKHKREKGEYTGSFAPYGYTVDRANKKLMIDEKVSPIVKEIFSLYNQGWGYKKIALYLNNSQVLCPSEYKISQGCNYKNPKMHGDKKLWTVPSVSAIIHNENYTGTLVQGKSHPVSYKNKKRILSKEADFIKIENAHESIISKEDFLKAKERFSNNSIRIERNPNEIFLFAGKVKCSVCGNAMRKNIRYNKAGEQRYSLICSGRDRGFCKCSNSKAFNGADFENLILEKINDVINNFCDIKNIDIFAEKSNKTHIFSQAVVELEKEKLYIENLSFNLYDDKNKGIISLEDFTLFKNKYQEKLKEIRDKIKFNEKEINSLNKKEDKKKQALSLFKRYKKIDRLSRELVMDFIDCIYVGSIEPDGTRNVEIHWKF